MSKRAGSVPTGFATTVNGRISGELKNGPYPASHELAGMLDRLDGEQRFSLSLWALPQGAPFDKVDLAAWPLRYMQAAGSRDRLTVEVRQEGASGERHSVCGWSPTVEATPTSEIRWQGGSTHVYAVEVFTAAEALPLFLAYLTSQSVAPGYTERVLDV